MGGHSARGGSASSRKQSLSSFSSCSTNMGELSRPVSRNSSFGSSTQKHPSVIPRRRNTVTGAPPVKQESLKKERRISNLVDIPSDHESTVGSCDNLVKIDN